MKILYKNKELNIDISIRTMLIFQKISKQDDFNPLDVSHVILLFYAAVTQALGEQPDYSEFFEYIADNQPVLVQFIKFLANEKDNLT